MKEQTSAYLVRQSDKLKITLKTISIFILLGTVELMMSLFRCFLKRSTQPKVYSVLCSMDFQGVGAKTYTIR